MCYHWQANSALHLQEEIKEWSDLQILDRLKSDVIAEEGVWEDWKIFHQRFYEEHPEYEKRENASPSGFYGGRLCAIKLYREILLEKLIGTKSSLTEESDQGIDSKDAIRLMR